MTAAANSPAPSDPAAPDAKPKPKAKGLVRWGVLVFLVVAFLGFAFLGAGRTIKWAVQKYGSQGLGSPVTVEKASFDVFKMAVTLEGVRVQDPVDPAKNQFEAKELRAKVDPIAGLRGQLVVDELAVSQPKGRIVRNTDGSINGMPPEEKKPGESESEWKRRMEERAKKRDLVEDVKNLFKKFKEERDAEIAKKKEEEERRRREGVPADPKEFRAARAGWVREARPLIVVHRIIADGVQLEIEDKGSGTPPQTLTNATVEVKELSTSPSKHDKPIEVKLDGEMANAPGSKVKLDGTVDVTGEASASSVLAVLQNLPLAQLDGLWKEAVPVAFRGGSIGNLTLPLKFKGWEIDWQPDILLDKIDAVARDDSQRIAGYPARDVAKGLKDVGTIALKNIHVYGPIWAPSVDIDRETIQELLTEAGKQKLRAEGQKQLGKLLENPQAKEAADKAKQALEKAGLDKTIESVPGVGDLFKKDDKSQSQTPPPSEDQKKPAETDKSAADKAGEAAKGATDAIGDFFGGKKK